MEKVVAYLYLFIFLGSLFLSIKILLDTNLEKCFKQGKVGSIRLFYLFGALIISNLIAWSITSIINVFYTILG